MASFLSSPGKLPLPGHDSAADVAVAEPNRVLLSKGMVDSDVVLVLMLSIRIGIESRCCWLTG